MNKIKIPFIIESDKDIEILFDILEDDKQKELTNRKLIKEFNKRKKEVKNEK